MSTAPNNPNPPATPVIPQPSFPPPRREPPTRVILEQGGGFFGRWSSRLGWLLFILALLYIAGMYGSYSSYVQSNPHIEEHLVSGEASAADKVAIITIDGVIMKGDGFAKWQIDQVRKDPSVKAVVVRVDSPGGTVTGSDDIYHQLVELANDPKRPMKLVVSMGAIAASGGYYVSMAVGDTPDSIFAEPATWTGSIGVLIPHYDISELLDKWNIRDDTVASNPLKLILSPTRKVSPEIAIQEHKILQTLVDDTFHDFKEIVKKGRPKFQQNPKALDDLATGQVYTAKQALEGGLVDKLGYQEEAVKRAIELNADKFSDRNNVRVVKYTLPQGLLSTLTGSSGSAPDSRPAVGGMDLAALLDLTAPRAYYLCSWLPALVTQRQQ